MGRPHFCPLFARCLRGVCAVFECVLLNLAYYSVLMAKGMTTDVYPRDNCI